MTPLVRAALAQRKADRDQPATLDGTEDWAAIAKASREGDLEALAKDRQRRAGLYGSCPVCGAHMGNSTLCPDVR
jgi:hypothetical protein